MQINTVNLANSYRVLLLENIFPNELLTQINLLCDSSETDNTDWQYPEWTKLRKIYRGTDSAYLEVKHYLSSKQFTESVEHILQKKMK